MLIIVASIIWILDVETMKAYLGIFGLGLFIGTGVYLYIFTGGVLITTHYIVKTKTPS